MSPDRRLSTGWWVAASTVATLAALAALAPVVGGTVGAGMHHLFSAVCHQIPERSPHFAGGPVALCHRCSGVLLGLLAGLMVTPALAAGTRRAIGAGRQGLWLVASALPTAVDWSLGAAGVWANTGASRLLTGAMFGVAAGVVLAANLLAPSHSPTLADA